MSDGVDNMPPSPSASVASERSTVAAVAVPASIKALPKPKLEVMLTKALNNLKQKDKRLADLEQSLSAFKAKLEHANKDAALTALKEQLQVAADEASRWKAECEGALQRTAEAEATVQTLVQASKDQGRANSDTIDELRAAADRWKRKCLDAEEVAGMHAQQSTTMKEALSAAMAEKETVFERLGEAHEKRSELQDALQVATAELHELRAEVEALREECAVANATAPSDRAADQLEDSLLSLRADLDDAVEGRQRLERELADARKQLEAAAADRENARGELAAALERNQALEEQLASSVAELAAVRADLDSARAATVDGGDGGQAASELAAVRAELEEVAAALQTALTGRQADADAAQESAASAEMQLSQALARVAELEAAREMAAAARGDDFASRLQAAEQELGATRTELERVTAELQGTRSVHAGTKQELLAAKVDLEAMVEKLNSAVDELAEARSGADRALLDLGADIAAIAAEARARHQEVQAELKASQGSAAELQAVLSAFYSAQSANLSTSDERADGPAGSPATVVAAVDVERLQAALAAVEAADANVRARAADTQRWLQIVADWSERERAHASQPAGSDWDERHCAFLKARVSELEECMSKHKARMEDEALRASPMRGRSAQGTPEKRVTLQMHALGSPSDGYQGHLNPVYVSELEAQKEYLGSQVEAARRECAVLREAESQSARELEWRIQELEKARATIHDLQRQLEQVTGVAKLDHDSLLDELAKHQLPAGASDADFRAYIAELEGIVQAQAEELGRLRGADRPSMGLALADASTSEPHRPHADAANGKTAPRPGEGAGADLDGGADGLAAPGGAASAGEVQSRLEAAEASAAVARASLLAEAAKVCELDVALSAARGRVEELEAAVSEAARARGEWGDEGEELRTRLAGLEASALEAAAQAREAQLTIEGLTAELSRSQDLVASTAATLVAAQADLAAADERESALQGRLQDAEAELASAHAREAAISEEQPDASAQTSESKRAQPTPAEELESSTQQEGVQEHMDQVKRELPASLDEAVAAWGEQLATLQAECGEAVAERDAALAARDAAIEQRDAALAARDAAIEQRDAACAERDAALRERDEALAARDAVSAERDAAAAAQLDAATELGRQLAEATQREAALQEQLAAARSALEQAEARVSELADSSGEATGALQATLEARGAECAQLRSRVAEVEARLTAEVAAAADAAAEEVKRIGAERDAAVAARDLAIAAQNASVEDVRRRAASALKKSKEQTTGQMSELQQELAEAKKSHHEMVCQLQRQLDHASEEVKRCEAIAEARAQSVVDAEEALSKAKEEVQQAKADAAQAAAAAVEEASLLRQEKEARIQELTDAVAALQTAVDEAKAAASASEAAAKEARSQAEAAKEKASKDVANRENKLKKALADMKHKLDAANTDKSRAEAAAAEARSQLDGMYGARATAEARAALFQEETKRLESQLHDYKARAQALLSAKDAEIARLASQEPAAPDAEALAAVERLTAELAAAQADVDAARAEADDFAAKLDEARAIADAQASRMRGLLDTAVAQAEAQSAAAAAARARCEALEARLAHRDAADATGGAPSTAQRRAAASEAAHAQAEAEMLRNKVESLELEFATFKDMSDRMASQREEALSLALGQVAELRRELDAERKLEQTPMPPRTPRNVLTAYEHAQERVSGRASDAALPRMRSFDIERMLDEELPALAEGQERGREEQGGHSSALARAEAQLAELQSENADLMREVALYEEQIGVLKEVVREAERNDKRLENSANLQTMQFLKANILNLYRTGEAERLLDPISSLLQFSTDELKACRDGIQRLKEVDTPLLGAANAVDSAWGFFGFGGASK